LITGVATATVVLCLTAVLSAMLERSGPIRVRHWIEEAQGAMRKLYRSPRRFEAFCFLLSVVAKVTPAVLFFFLVPLVGAVESQRSWLVALGITLAAVAAVEYLNRRLVGHDPEGVLRGLTRAYSLARMLLTPLLGLTATFMPQRNLQRLEEDDDEVSDEEINAFIDVGTREGILDHHEGELVRSVVDFGDTLVRSVMTPRIDLVCASVEASLDEVAEIFAESTHSRIPLYQRSIDQIVGVLHLRDLLRGLRSAPQPPLKKLAKPIWLVPETKPLDEVLKELQERRQQVAVVVDEYGGTAGLVTIEDLLEEIVGEIVDSDEELPPQIQRLPDGGWLFDGRMRVEELERIFNITVDDEPYDTVGGLVFTTFGYVPEPGEVTETHGLRLTVEAVDERRVQSVRAEKLATDEDEEEAGNGQ
jgi:CBS domain containing-hemolysin-like protein